MLSSNTVITFGLTENQNSTIGSHVEGLGCNLVKAGSYHKLITADYFLCVINRAELDADALKGLVAFYTEIDGNLTQRMILADKPDGLSKAAHAIVYPDFDVLKAEFATLLKKAHSKAKDSENTIQNISDAITILNALKTQRSMTTEQLAEKINRSAPAVRRFIEVVRVADEPITYNAEAGCWEFGAKQSTYCRLQSNK